MEKYRVRNKKRINYNGGFTITKSWFECGIHKCKAVNDLMKNIHLTSEI